MSFMTIPHEAPETGLASSYHTAIIWITFITFCSGLRVCDCAIKEIASGAKLYHQIPQRSTFDIFVPCQAVAKGGLNKEPTISLSTCQSSPGSRGASSAAMRCPRPFPGQCTVLCIPGSVTRIRCQPNAWVLFYIILSIHAAMLSSFQQEVPDVRAVAYYR